MSGVISLYSVFHACVFFSFSSSCIREELQCSSDTFFFSFSFSWSSFVRFGRGCLDIGIFCCHSSVVPVWYLLNSFLSSVNFTELVDISCCCSIFFFFFKFLMHVYWIDQKTCVMVYIKVARSVGWVNILSGNGSEKP